MSAYSITGVRRRFNDFEYAEECDKALKEVFNEDFETVWNVFAGSFGGYQTFRKNGKKLTKSHALFAAGWSRGHLVTRTFVEHP